MFPSSCVRACVCVCVLSDDSFPSSRFVPKPVYASFKLYKPKTALDIAPVRAQLQWNSSQQEERKYLSMKRAGGFRLTFASGEGRAYDWSNSQIISLSVIDLGDVLAFADDKSQGELKITHDPGFGSDAAGRVTKDLILKRIGNDKPGYFFNFAVTEGDQPARKWSIAVSEGEMRIFTTLIQQTLPALLAITSGTKPNIIERDDANSQRQ